MPRERAVTMGVISPQESHEAAIKKAIKLHSPFEVVSAELANVDDKEYAVVYRAPRGNDRYVAATRSKKKNAYNLRDMLNRAWAEGYYASLRE